MKFTVVIPTRERADTLYYSLKTCVTQDYDNLDIIVSDNFSQDNTREVVESFRDPRIRYINTGERVAMAANWEFALSHVTNGYVTYIGDDDGLLPNAVCRVSGILTKHPASAICYPQARYFWPNCHEEENRHILTLPTGHQVFVISAKKALRAASHLVYIGGALPGVYTGFVELKVLQAIRARTGRFFGSMIPDYYSAFAVMAMTDSYLCSRRTLGVAGLSAKSNGQAYLCRGAADPIARMFFEEGPLIPCHPAVSLVDRVPIFSAAEPLLQVSASLFDGRLRINMCRVVSLAYRIIAAMSPEDYAIRRAKIRDIAQRNGLAWFARLCERRYPNRPAEGCSASAVGIQGQMMTVNCKAFGVENVYDASILAEKLLQEYRPTLRPVPYTYATALRERLSVFLRI